jgi:hypothetical protein
MRTVTDVPNRSAIALFRHMSRLVIGFSVLFVVLCSASRAAAEPMIGVLAGATTGGQYAENKFAWDLLAGYWFTPVVAVEGRVESVPHAFAESVLPGLAPLGQPSASSISVLAVDISIAPWTHRGALWPYGVAGVGRFHSLLQGERIALDAAALSWEAGGGIAGDITKRVSFRFDLQYVRDTGELTAAGGVNAPGPSMWRGAGGLLILFL